MLQALEFQLHLFPQLFIQRPQGFVEQQDPRALDQCTGQGHPLALPAGQLIGLAIGQFSKLCGAQHLIDPLADLRLRQALHLQAVGNVLAHSHVGKQRIGLEHQVQRPLVGRQRRDVQAVEVDAASAGGFESGEHAQQRGLAAA
ncbi:hypothetical protein D3C85_1530850 [compost metagenome]